ncbi:MAG TPA: serine/threonine-protein kinase [Candidatus Angelobacter sp.]|nr:serine/threonine-protein kinase [Candidatus Angelobacter sp.]
MTSEATGRAADDAGALRERAIAEAVARFVDCQAQGENTDIVTFCRQHASLLPELQAQLETIHRIDTVLDSGHASPVSAPPDETMGKRFSGFHVLDQLGSGGMGRVFLAADERLNRKVAIKVLAPRYWPDKLLAERFMREAQAMAQLSHPNIARIYSLGAPDEPPHFVMEYIPGAPLTQAARVLRLPQRMELFRKVVLAVEFLHQRGLVHRDLKPANILVGSDLEPKLLDFGLALQLDPGERQLTRPGEVLGTPDYFSPEQAQGEGQLDSRSDVFSLGVILYQLLTGRLPFHGETLRAQVEALREQDPVLPRRIEESVPGDLQNICLKALEKDPKDRYASAREMAADLERFLADEPVSALPTAYARLISGKIEQHVRELRSWTQDHLLSDLEFDSFRRQYERLVEREDAWIMQVRRLSFSQVTLYLGAWILVLGAVLVVLFDYRRFAGTAAVLVTAAAAATAGYIGIRCWRENQRRIGVAYLLAFCLLLPLALMVVMGQYHLLVTPSQNNPKLEFFARFESFREATNAQLWWSIILSLPGYLWLRRFTRSSVFSLVLAFMGAVLCMVTLLRMGLLEWLDSDPGRVYLRLLPFALLFFLLGIVIERWRLAADSRYFYFFAVAFTLVGMSGVAGVHAPYANWLRSVVPRTRGQQEYLFMINAALYFTLQQLCDRFPSAEMRWVAKTFRFVIPGHILTSLLLLGLSASDLWEKAQQDIALRHEARFFEILLPLAACLFIFGSIAKQMKNFLVTGLLFLAIGVIRLQQELFKQRAALPLSLLLAGLLLMIAAANYPSLKAGLLRHVRRKS